VAIAPAKVFTVAHQIPTRPELMLILFERVYRVLSL